jgi:cyclohexyl-isocyanide hydratase
MGIELAEDNSESGNIVVGFPLYQEVTLLDFAGATQVFASAGGCQPIWLAKSTAPIMTSEGVTVNPQFAFADDHPKIDVLFVPGGGGDGVADAMLDSEIQDFVQRTAKTAQWSGSVCVGAFILATAGLLDGCHVTTYWSALNILQRFPSLTVDTECYPRCLVNEEKRRFSGGGVSSSNDLALELVVRLKNQRAADRADLAIQYAPHPPVISGDPSTASPELVKQMCEKQAIPFLKPISDVTNTVLNHVICP